MDIEHMFDKDSFTDEITSSSEAQAAYSYFAHNLTTFKAQLASEGLSYEQVGERVRQCWANLIQSSQRVGFLNGHLQRMAKLYKVGINKALLKKPSSEEGK